MGTIFLKIFPFRITAGKGWHTVLREVMIMDNRNYNGPENKDQPSTQNKKQPSGQNKKEQDPANKRNSNGPENKGGSRGY